MKKRTLVNRLLFLIVGALFAWAAYEFFQESRKADHAIGGAMILFAIMFIVGSVAPENTRGSLRSMGYPMSLPNQSAGKTKDNKDMSIFNENAKLVSLFVTAELLLDNGTKMQCSVPVRIPDDLPGSGSMGEIMDLVHQKFKDKAVDVR